MMNKQLRLALIRLLHTVVWLFFNAVIFYMLYAAVTNRLDVWLWTGYALVITEGIVLTCFKLVCPSRSLHGSTRIQFAIILTFTSPNGSRGTPRLSIHRLWYSFSSLRCTSY
jgi:hypothetical protein